MLGLPETTFIGKRSGSVEACLSYCQKPDAVIDSTPRQHGTPQMRASKSGQRTDFKKLCDAIDAPDTDIRDLMDHPGPTGRLARRSRKFVQERCGKRLERERSNATPLPHDPNALWPWQRGLYNLATGDPDPENIFVYYDTPRDVDGRIGISRKCYMSKVLVHNLGVLRITPDVTPANAFHMLRDRHPGVVVLLDERAPDLTFLRNLKRGAVVTGKYDGGDSTVMLRHVFVLALYPLQLPAHRVFPVVPCRFP
eukprot:5440278-Prymnesium_polylepis.5